MTRYTRDDVQTHGSLPAVNVKVYKTLHDAWSTFVREEKPDPRFTLDWIEEHVSETELDSAFWMTCEHESEYLRDWATSTDKDDSLFPDDRLRLWHEGRSSGWIVVSGLPEIEEWDAVRLARWRRFERIARNIADGIPHAMLNALYFNEFEAWADEQDDAAVYNAEVPVELHPALS
jgi:hypothetical protein